MSILVRLRLGMAVIWWQILLFLFKSKRIYLKININLASPISFQNHLLFVTQDAPLIVGRISHIMSSSQSLFLYCLFMPLIGVNILKAVELIGIFRLVNTFSCKCIPQVFIVWAWKPVQEPKIFPPHPDHWQLHFSSPAEMKRYNMPVTRQLLPRKPLRTKIDQPVHVWYFMYCSFFCLQMLWLSS